MQTFRYSPEATDDFAQIAYYYEENAGLDVAREMTRKIRTAIRATLGRFPRSGRLRPEFGAGVRSYPVLPYIVFYVADKKDAYILRILHANRDIRAPLMSVLTA